jgi:penicillin-binding protein 2
VGVRQNEKYNAARLSEFQRDHSLYIAYAPADNPTIAVAAIVENAGFGAAAAAPLARRVFDYWLLGRYPSLEDMAAMRKGQAGVPIGTPRRVSEITLDAETVNLPGLPRYEPPEAPVPVPAGRPAVLSPPSAAELED